VTVTNVAPVVDAGGPYSGAAGEVITLTASGSDPGGGVITYTWDLDDDGQFDDGSGSTVTYTWQVAGTYTVTVRAEDAQGLTSTDAASVDVGAAGVDHIVISPSAATILEGGGQAYSAEAFDAYDNSLGDVTNDTTFTIESGADGGCAGNVCTATADGVWTVTGTYIGLTDTAVLTVTNVAPTILEITDTGPAAEGSPITLTVSADDPGSDTLTYAFDWDNDGDFNDPDDVPPYAQTSSQASHAWPDDGMYTVRVRVYDDDTYTEATHQVSVLNAPPVADAGGPYTVAAGDTVTLTAAASHDPGSADTLTYTWDLDNDGLFGDAVGVTAPFSRTATGVYTVTVRVTDDDASSATDTARVTVTPAALSYIVLSPSEVGITAGEAQTYTVEAFDGLDNPIGDVSTSTTFEISSLAGGTWSQNVYTSQKAGVWTVTATYGTVVDTAVLTVTPGITHHVVIEPVHTSVFAGDPVTYTLWTADRFENLIADVSADAVFTVGGGAGGGWVGNVYHSEVVGRWIVTGTYQTWSAQGTLDVLERYPYRVYLPLIARDR
jgi:hypothetical protein